MKCHTASAFGLLWGTVSEHSYTPVWSYWSLILNCNRSPWVENPSYGRVTGMVRNCIPKSVTLTTPHTFTLTHRDQGCSESRCLVSSLFISTWSITKPMWYIQSPWNLVYKRLLGMNIQRAALSGTHESVLLMSFYNSEQTVSPAVYTCNT